MGDAVGDGAGLAGAGAGQHAQRAGEGLGHGALVVVKGGATANWPVVRKLLSRSANIYASVLLGLGVRDATAGFRAFADMIGGDRKALAAQAQVVHAEPIPLDRIAVPTLVLAGDTVPCEGLDALCEGAEVLVITVVRQDLIDAITSHAPGAVVELGLQPLAGGDTRLVPVTLAGRPDDPGRAMLGVSTFTRDLSFDFLKIDGEFVRTRYDSLSGDDMQRRWSVGGDVAEVILATDPDTQGEATAAYLSRMLKDFGVQVTRPASGLPVGGDLEYADHVTLGRAFEGRRSMYQPLTAE